MNQVDIERTLDKIRYALEKDDLPAAISTLSKLHPADLADAFSDLPEPDQAALLPNLNLDATADLLEELEDDEAVDIAGTLTTERLADVLDAMEPDEAADVLGDLPAEIAAKALAEMEDAIEVIPLLGHDDETAGGLMTTSFIALRPTATAARAIEYLRQIRPEEETPYYLYVIDSDRRLIGVVSLRSLLVAEPAANVGSFMDPSVIHVTTETDQEDVARLMVRYDLAALPVVDERGVLWGVITYDDLMDVLEDEATEDIYRLANVADADLAVDSPVGLAVRRRLPWLYLNTLTALFAAWVISNFEDLFTQVAVLAVFQSVVAGMGGNVATQSLALVVRAIALGEISRRQAWSALWKQVSAGVIQGLAVGLVVGLGVYIWKGSPFLGLILGLALFGNMLVAVAAGTIVPLVLHAIKLDPALASSIFVTAITDSIGFALFLGLASIFLPYLNG
ncbi:MAG: magnesium transporter [Anaerolineales bacterium]|jgi:magnesium transporter